jgi:hypothetical protein
VVRISSLCALPPMLNVGLSSALFFATDILIGRMLFVTE